MELKFVSIIMPCRNEVDFIENAIKSVFAQDYPRDRLEVIVADGMSDDGTTQILHGLANTHSELKVIENPHRATPHGLNAAIETAKGEIIIRFDAHAVFPSNYVSALVNALDTYKADNVGGVLNTLPAAQNREAISIALAMSSKFGVGNADFRTGSQTVTEVDTVPFGCFRKSVFEELGLFDTDLIRNQDDEFNARMIQAGKKIILLPDVEITYFARSTFRKMRQMYFQYGLFKPLVNQKLKHPATLRQFVPPLFVLSFILFPVSLISGGLAFAWASVYVLYFGMNLIFSLRLAASEKKTTLIPYLVLAFFYIHISYGWGYLRGFFRFAVFKKAVDIDRTHLSR
mgnify:CR=1 FL=1